MTVTLAAASAAPVLGPGLGLSNLRLYAGAPPGRVSFASAAVVVMVALAAVILARRASLDGPRLVAGAAGVAMIALWLAPSAGPDDVLVPIALLAIAATCPPRDSFDTPEAAL